uniref:Uncharacterized protein n=1 Tax=uncultured prokaryote TaxID=198431 RepID=A0A0H5Q4C2_9ZZZZ|nr:hypothetical protein [uncultured prokaryote]
MKADTKRFLGDAVDGDLVQLNFNNLARAMGFSRAGLDAKLRGLGWMQVWAEAKRLASERASEAADPSAAKVHDADIFEAATSILQSPFRGSSK